MKLDIEFAKLVVEGWQEFGKLSQTMIKFIKPPTDVVLTPEDWNAGCLKAGISEHMHLKQDVRSWVASHFHNANTALWDGKFELAWKWMASGKDVPPAPSMRRIKPTDANDRKRERETVFLRMRELSKKHDWNTCK